MKTKNVEYFLEKMPKTDLHVHLDGSLRLETLIELAKEYKVELPSYTEAGLKETVFKESYRNLVEYLQGFSYTCAVLRTPESLERCAYELAKDNITENVRYIEVRYAPQQHICDAMPELDVIISSVDKGLKKAAEEHNRTEAVTSGHDIPFTYGIIVGALRYFNRELSPYYAGLIDSLPHLRRKDIFSCASLELAYAAVKIKREKCIPVVGFDLCGAESGFPAIGHSRAFKYIHRNFLGKTVHAGEAYGPESMFQAITECHANRLGHGTFLFDHNAVSDNQIKNPEEFCDSLAEYIARRRITIESCPTSNLQTIPAIENIKNHPIGKMIDKKLSVTLCTDNRLISNTTVTEEYKKVIEGINVSKKQLRDLVIAGVKGCFYHDTYAEHRAFVRLLINRYVDLEKEYLNDFDNSDIV
ncbi:MAG: adenosine deaminase family protein [Victivallales bacterium]|nr:adenosine deaminase family protein [Victivallales bacterium]